MSPPHLTAFTPSGELYFIDREQKAISRLTPNHADKVLTVQTLAVNFADFTPSEFPPLIPENALLYECHPDSTHVITTYKWTHIQESPPKWLIAHAIDREETYIIHTENPQILLTVDHDDENDLVTILACTYLWNDTPIPQDELTEIIHAAKDHLIFQGH